MSAVFYVDDSGPGITRIKVGKKWKYVDARGRQITRASEIERLNKIGLPPAYRDAWFCPKPDGHIQAIGWDAKGRKQYRYHVAFRAARETEKYGRCSEFGMALPLIRKRVESDLDRPASDRDAVLAAIVRLLDRGRVRIGNHSYARANASFGATTLQTDHVVVKGATVKFDYVGKSGKTQSFSIDDKRLARVVRRCRDEAESQLFEYVDAAGLRRTIGSTDVNDYLREVTGSNFTAKHFRTWGASVIALGAILETEGAITMKTMLDPVAKALGNTPAIARKSYVHPAVIDLLDDPKRVVRLRAAQPRATAYLSRTERALIKLLAARPRQPRSLKAALLAS